MSPQQTIKMRQQMIQETEEFLNQELDRRRESDPGCPRIPEKTLMFDSWHHSFTSRDTYDPYLQVKPARLQIS